MASTLQIGTERQTVSALFAWLLCTGCCASPVGFPVVVFVQKGFGVVDDQVSGTDLQQPIDRSNMKTHGVPMHFNKVLTDSPVLLHSCETSPIQVKCGLPPAPASGKPRRWVPYGDHGAKRWDQGRTTAFGDLMGSS